MDRNALVTLVVLAAFVFGGLLGYAAGIQRSRPPAPRAAPSPAAAAEVAGLFRAAAQKDQAARETARQTCLREKLGPERYAALVLNPSAATPADQFRILPCQNV